MAGTKRRWQGLGRFGLAAASAILFALSFEPFGLAPLAWIALAPLLVALRGAPPASAGLTAFAFGVLAFGIPLHWLFRIFGLATVGLLGLCGAVLWAFGLCFSLLERRLGAVGALLLSPVLWVGIDLFRSELWYFAFSWLQLGFTQAETPVVLGLAAVLGVYGITFLLVLSSATVALLLGSGRIVRGVALAAGIAAAAAWIGRIPVREGEAEAAACEPFPVAAVQCEFVELDRLLELTEACAGKARLIVWPEGSIQGYPLDEAVTLARLAEAARRQEAYLVAGCKERVPGGAARAFYNTAIILSPTGDVVGTYHKNHPVQFLDDGVRGTKRPIFATPLGRMGLAICYDLDFASHSHDLVRGGAEFLVVPTCDAMWWREVQHRQHAGMTATRAVEHARWIVRAASSGISQIVDPRGRVRRELGVGHEGVLLGAIEACRGSTAYDRAGYLLPYICLGLVIAYVFFEALARLRGRLRRAACRGSVGAASGALLLLAASGCGGASHGPSLTVFAAASLSDAMAEAAAAFARTGAIEVRPSFAGTPLLARQIEQGAPADLFVAANEQWIDYLLERGRIVPNSVTRILSNRLALVAPTSSRVRVEPRRGVPVAQAFPGRLALADPEAVPAGIYAKEALRSLGWWGSVRDRLAPAPDVRAALAYVERGACELGIVYRSDARASRRVREVAVFPAEAHRPIVYPVGIVIGRDGPAARRFLAFLRSSEAKAVFRAHGFEGDRP